MARTLLFLVILSCLSALARAQTVPENEVQVNLSGYFDSFNVSVVYPNISYTRKVGESTSLSARYLVDMITAASIKSNTGGSNKGDDLLASPRVDAITGASSRGGNSQSLQAPGISFDDVRNEIGLGLTRALGPQLLSVNGIYSKERDYTSGTIAGTLTRFLARNNTTFQLGVVRSWDRIYPKTKDWTRRKNVTTLSANFSQVLNKNLLVQFLASYSNYNGLLSDSYQLVTVSDNPDSVVDPVHPDLRIRRSAAARFKYRLGRLSSLQMGYRYYWDSWNVVSHTYSGNYQRYLSRKVILGLGLRSYFQSRAFFFKPSYSVPEELMTVDIKLDSQYSNELQLNLTVNGGEDQESLPFLSDERVAYDFGLSLYQRHSDTPYWFNGSKNMISTNMNISIRYHF